MKRKKRPYVLKARQDQVLETRSRIVDAIIALHQERGPSRTTISAVAARAGVERLTVYRHFQDEAAMLAACSHRYLELNPLPSPASWADVDDPMLRTQRGLQELYAFFRRTAPMFEKVYRDVEVSVSVKAVMGRFDAHLRELADSLADAWPRDAAVPECRIILRHAAKFATWQSLEVDGVSNSQKVELVLQWLSGFSSAKNRR